MKASPLPLTLRKLESFSIVEPGGRKGIPTLLEFISYLYSSRTQILQDPAGSTDSSELHSQEIQLVSSKQQ